MASAVLANNEPNWTQSQPRGGAKFMGKVPYSNANPNPKSSKKRQFHPAQPVVNLNGTPALMQSAASDDASSINRRPANDFNAGGYRTYNIATYSKKELVELKNRFLAELEQIRQLKDRINSSELQIRSGSNFNSKKPIPTPTNKKVLGNKRPFPATNFGFGSKGIKRSNHPEQGQLMKKCGQILSTLMKHKHGKHIFNAPVNVEALKLHDYHDIIKNPMDLGTVKSKLSKNLYESPLEFADDVRLTFNNAMTYNPKGHAVYSYAQQLLSRFEESFRPIQDKLGEDHLDRVHEQDYIQEVQASSWDHNPIRGDFDRIQADQENVMPIAPSYEHIAKPVPPSGSNPQSTSQLPVRTPSPMRAPPVKPLKQPKPKAKDPNKRDMSLEEKHKLGLGLQSLPQEKMLQVVQIIKKRNGNLTQDGDEIELDIEAVDTETLWELDRFVTNFKKMASKMKRQALMGVSNAGAAVIDGNNDVSGNEAMAMDVVTEAKKPKKGDAGDEDVDIGDEMPMSSFPPVEIERDNGNGSSSSSSSSSSSDGSSSSDSDSGSSSGSESEDAHS